MTPVEVVAAGGQATRDGAAPGSILAHLQARADAQRRDRGARRLDLAVGGAFGDALRVRYRPLPVDELERYAGLTDINNLALSIDMMIGCCETVLWREHDTDTDLGVRLGVDLWRLLDWPLPDGVELTPREVVTGLFADDAMALGRHLERLVAWMSEGEERPPGEASAASS